MCPSDQVSILMMCAIIFASVFYTLRIQCFLSVLRRFKYLNILRNQAISNLSMYPQAEEEDEIEEENNADPELSNLRKGKDSDDEIVLSEDELKHGKHEYLSTTNLEAP